MDDQTLVQILMKALPNDTGAAIEIFQAAADAPELKKRILRAADTPVAELAVKHTFAQWKEEKEIQDCLQILAKAKNEGILSGREAAEARKLVHSNSQFRREVLDAEKPGPLETIKEILGMSGSQSSPVLPSLLTP
jgi:hypothetical protein